MRLLSHSKRKKVGIELEDEAVFIFLKLNVVVGLLAIRDAREWWKNFARLVRSWGEMDSECGIHQLIVTPSSGSIISWTSDLKHQFYTFMTSSSSSLFSINSHDWLGSISSVNRSSFLSEVERNIISPAADVMINILAWNDGHQEDILVLRLQFKWQCTMNMEIANIFIAEWTSSVSRCSYHA